MKNRDAFVDVAETIATTQPCQTNLAMCSDPSNPCKSNANGEAFRAMFQHQIFPCSSSSDILRSLPCWPASNEVLLSALMIKASLGTFDVIMLINTGSGPGLSRHRVGRTCKYGSICEARADTPCWGAEDVIFKLDFLPRYSVISYLRGSHFFLFSLCVV